MVKELAVLSVPRVGVRRPRAPENPGTGGFQAPCCPSGCGPEGVHIGDFKTCCPYGGVLTVKL